VLFEKSGKGGRLLHQESAHWNRLAGGFLLLRERVAVIEVVCLFGQPPIVNL